jgi:hypothetical protein
LDHPLQQSGSDLKLETAISEPNDLRIIFVENVIQILFSARFLPIIQSAFGSFEEDHGRVPARPFCCVAKTPASFSQMHVAKILGSAKVK